MQDAHREDLRRQNAELTQRHEEYVRSLRERVVGRCRLNLSNQH